MGFLTNVRMSCKRSPEMLARHQRRAHWGRHHDTHQASGTDNGIPVHECELYAGEQTGTCDEEEANICAYCVKGRTVHREGIYSILQLLFTGWYARCRAPSRPTKNLTIMAFASIIIRMLKTTNCAPKKTNRDDEKHEGSRLAFTAPSVEEITTHAPLMEGALSLPLPPGG